MPSGKPFVGIDLGGTNMQFAVVNSERKIIGSARRKTKADDERDAVIGRLIDGVLESCAAAKVSLKDIAAVGLGAPGVIDPTGGIVLEAVNLRWENVPLAKILGERLGVPAFIDNDVNAAVVGEHRMGAGRGARDILGVWMGTGVGGGLIFDNKLYYGHYFSAGEIGHMTVNPGGQPGTRSLEQNCSRTSVVERLVRLIKSNRKSLITDMVGGDLDGIKSKIIGEAFRKEDPLTVEVVTESAMLLGTCIGGVVTLLSLERIILGGGLTEALGQPYVRIVRDSLRKSVFPSVLRKVDVVATELADDAGPMGAALIAMERLAQGK
jgi:glucokinase